MNWLIVGVIFVLILFLINKYSNARGNFWYFFWVAVFLFFSVSVYYIDSTMDHDLMTIDGVQEVGKVYFSWFTALGKNVANVGGYAIKQDWSFESDNLNSTMKK